MKISVFALGALVGLVLGGGLIFAGSATGLIKVPTPETCLLGFPNSDSSVVFEATGKGAWELCDDITNPIRQVNALQGASVLAANTWAPLRLCQFDKYGLAWTIYAKRPIPPEVFNPCASGV